MENVNIIKFFLFLVVFFSFSVGILISNLVREQKTKEKQYVEIISEISKENFELISYKMKNEFNK